ncbi:MAG: RDD family protein [Pseudolysinimonas sp.]
MSNPAEQRWPGERLGLPQAGPRSIARSGRRLGALAIDWAIAYGLSLAFFPTGPWQTDGFITLGLFAAEQVLFLLVLNGSVGHLILRMRVVPLQPGRLGLWRPFVRTALLCLFVPALIMDADQRGLHDRVAGTLLVCV